VLEYDGFIIIFPGRLLLADQLRVARRYAVLVDHMAGRALHRAVRTIGVQRRRLLIAGNIHFRIDGIKTMSRFMATLTSDSRVPLGVAHERIGELQFAAKAGTDAIDAVEDFRLQNVTAKHAVARFLLLRTGAFGNRDCPEDSSAKTRVENGYYVQNSKAFYIARIHHAGGDDTSGTVSLAEPVIDS